MRDYNIAIEQFPGSVIAGSAQKAEYFEIDTIAALTYPLEELSRPTTVKPTEEQLHETT